MWKSGLIWCRDTGQTVPLRPSQLTPVSCRSFLASPPSLVCRTLREELGRRVGRNSGPQSEDALPLLYLLSTQKPAGEWRQVRTFLGPTVSEVLQLCGAYLLLYLFKASRRCCPLSGGGVLDSYTMKIRKKQGFLKFEEKQTKKF